MRRAQKGREGMGREARRREARKSKIRGGARHAFPLFMHLIHQAQSVEPVVMIDWQAGFRKITAD